MCVSPYRPNNFISPENRVAVLTKPVETYTLFCRDCEYNNGVREKDKMPCGIPNCLKSLDNLATGGTQ